MSGKRLSAVFIVLLAALPACIPQPSTGLDLTVRGNLFMVFNRTSGSAQASAAAKVNDVYVPFTRIDLADDQVLSVNGVPLTPNWATVLTFGIVGQVAAQFGAVSAPGVYTIAFNDRGRVSTMTVTPPQDFTAFTPAAGSQVSRSSFVVTWSPSGESGVTIDVTVSGLMPDTGDDYDTDNLPDPQSVYLTGLADNGSVTIGLADLAPLLPGAVTLSVDRVRTVPQSLGLAGGTIQLLVTKEVALTLKD